METQKELINGFIKNPTKENYELIKDDYLALSIIYKRLEKKDDLFQFFRPEGMFAVPHHYYVKMVDLCKNAFDELKEVALDILKTGNKSFEYWVEIAKDSQGELLHLSLDSIGDYKMEFEEWFNLWLNSEGKLKILAFAEMFKISNSFDYWVLFCFKNETTKGLKPYSAVINNLACKDISTYASSYDEWIFICMYGQDELPIKAIAEIKKLKRSYGKWKETYDSIAELNLDQIIESELQDVVEAKLIEEAEHFDEVDFVYSELLYNSSMLSPKEIVEKKEWLEKLKKLALTGEQYVIVYEYSVGEEKKVAAKNLLKDFDYPFMYLVFLWRNHDGVLKQLIFEKLNDWETTFDGWKGILSNIDRELVKDLENAKIFKDLIIEKMINLIETYEEYYYVTSSISTDSEEDYLDLLPKKAMLLEKTVDEWIESFTGRNDFFNASIIAILKIQNASFDQFKLVFEKLDGNKDVFVDDILESLHKEAEGFDELYFVASNSSEQFIEGNVAELADIACSEDEWLKVLKLAPTKELKNLAFAKLESTI